MELAEYNITFIYIKGKNNVLVDAISRLKILNIYKEPMENPKTQAVSSMQEHVMEVHETNIHTLNATMLHACKKLVSLLHHSNKGNFKSVIMSANSILQKQHVHGLKHDVTIAPYSLVPPILPKFYHSKVHQGTIHTFEAIRISILWPKLWQDIVKYTDQCSACAKNLPDMARYTQKYLEIPQIPMTLLAIDA